MSMESVPAMSPEQDSKAQGNDSKVWNATKIL